MNTTTSKSANSTDTTVLPRRKRTIRDRIFSNLPQKLIALVCSLLLFTIVVSDRNVVQTVSQIPVEIVIPEGYVAIDASTQTTVDVFITGRASQLKDIKRDDFGIIRPTPKPRDGNVQITLKKDMITLPEGVHVDHFSPEFLSINMEPLEHRKVTVTTDNAFTGELPQGYQRGEVKLQPETIEISGPRSVISDVSQLYIEPIDLTGKASTFKVNRWVILDRTGLTSQSTQVEVTVNIVSTARQHVVLGVPIIPLNLSQKHEFVPPTIDLTLVGDEESLAKIDASRLFITVDASKDDGRNNHARLLSSSDYTVPNLPAGVGVDESKLPSVLFKVWRDTDDNTDADE